MLTDFGRGGKIISYQIIPAVFDIGCGTVYMGTLRTTAAQQLFYRRQAVKQIGAG